MIIQWFAPALSGISASRISLDFDRRSADLSFRELMIVVSPSSQTMAA